MLGSRESNTPCRKTRYDVRRVTLIYRRKSADRRVNVYGQNVLSDVFFTKVLLYLFMTVASKDINSLHALSKS